MSSGLSRRVATVVGMRVSAMLSPWGPLVWVVDSVRALCLIFGFFCVLSGVGLLSVWSCWCWCRCWWCSGFGDLDWSFFFFDSRLLSVLGGSWMLADVALGCGWSAVGGVGGVGGVGEGGGGGGGGGGDGGGVVLAGKVVAAESFNKRTYSAVLGLLFMLLYRHLDSNRIYDYKSLLRHTSHGTFEI